MKTPCRLLPLLGALLLAAASAVETRAQANSNPPERMTYQGFLVDANGTALGNSAPRNYDVVFRVWTAQTGGNRLWSEQQTVTVDPLTTDEMAFEMAQRLGVQVLPSGADDSANPEAVEDSPR